MYADVVTTVILEVQSNPNAQKSQFNAAPVKLATRLTSFNPRPSFSFQYWKLAGKRLTRKSLLKDWNSCSSESSLTCSNHQVGPYLKIELHTLWMSHIK